MRTLVNASRHMLFENTNKILERLTDRFQYLRVWIKRFVFLPNRCFRERDQRV